MLKQALLNVVAVVVVFSAQAQSYKERLGQMKQHYDEVTSAHIRMTVNVYTSDKSRTPIFSEEADIKRKFANYHYEMGDIDMMMNDRVIIMVNKQDKAMRYTTRTLEGQRKFKDVIGFSVDSLFRLGTPELVETINDIEHYRIANPDNLIKVLDIFVNIKNNEVIKLEYRYENDQYVNIIFTSLIRLLCLIRIHSMKIRYFKKEKDKLIGVGNFKDFKIEKVTSRYFKTY